MGISPLSMRPAHSWQRVVWGWVSFQKSGRLEKTLKARVLSVSLSFFLSLKQSTKLLMIQNIIFYYSSGCSDVTLELP